MGCFEKLWVSCLTALVFRARFVATGLGLSVQVIGGDLFFSLLWLCKCRRTER